VREILDLQPTVRDIGTERLESSGLTHGFEIQDVSFSYGRIAVLNNLTLRIVAGENIAIVGASGSGKSTLARLLVRGADPDNGRTLLEKRPLTDYALGSLRSAVCYVPQQPMLFQGTIRDNLLYANPRASDEEMFHAVEAAQLASVLNRFPQGLNALLGPGAVGFSGGERQRLALARSLLRGSAALVLDEATSALDVPTEREVLESVASFRAHQTIIVISHRLRSLSWVDRLVLLEHGRIAAVGAHSVLYEESALCRSLFDASVRDMSMPLQQHTQGAPKGEAMH
jgi:ABC-type multidrug transport system fused ATPase/permease subunit